MAGSVGKLAIEFIMGFDASQFTSGGNQAVATFKAMANEATTAGGIIVSASSGLGKASNDYAVLNSMMENTNAITNQLARNQKSLFAAGKKSGRGPKSNDDLRADQEVQTSSTMAKEQQVDRDQELASLKANIVLRNKARMDEAAQTLQISRAMASEQKSQSDQMFAELKADITRRNEERLRGEAEAAAVQQQMGSQAQKVGVAIAAEEQAARQAGFAALKADIIERNNAIVLADQQRQSQAQKVGVAIAAEEQAERDAGFAALKADIIARNNAIVLVDQQRQSQARQVGAAIASEEQVAKDAEFAALKADILERNNAIVAAEQHKSSELERYRQQEISDDKTAHDQGFADLKADIIRRNKERIEGEKAAAKQRESVEGHRNSGGRVLRGMRPPEEAKTATELGSQLKGEEATAKSLYLQYKKIFQERDKALKAGEDIVDGAKREKDAEELVLKSAQDVERTKKRIEDTTEQEAASQKKVVAGYHDAHVIMQQLGNKESIEVIVRQKIAENAERFAEALERAGRSGKTPAELAAMQAQFDKVNTVKSVQGQIKGQNMLGAAFQQGAYGMEDFASQIERGFIPALGGAANNINMIVGMLGPPWMMAVSVGAIAGLQFAKALGFISKEAAEGSTSIEKATEHIETLTEKLNMLRDSAELRINVSFDKDVDSLVGELNGLMSGMEESIDRVGEMARENMLEGLKEKIDALWWESFRESFAAADDAGAQQRMDEAQRKQLAAEKLLDELGGNLTEEMREQLDLANKIGKIVDDQLFVEQRRLSVANDLIARMQQGLGPAEDTRSTTQSLADAVAANQTMVDLAAERLKVEEELFHLQTDEATMIAAGANLSQEIVDRAERLREIQVESTQAAEEFTKAQERNDEAREKSIEALKSVDEKMAEINGRGDEYQALLKDGQKEIDEWLELLKEIDGFGAKNVVLQQIYTQTLAATNRELKEANKEGLKEDDLQKQIDDKLKERSKLVRELNALTRANAGLGAEDLAKRQMLVEAEKELAELRGEARSALEGEMDAIESKLGAMDKEWAKQKKINKEREKLKTALNAAVETNLISKDRRIEVLDAFDVATAKEKELEGLKEQLSNTTAAGEVSVVERDSKEAQSIILAAMREGQQRNEQDQVVAAIEKVNQAIEAQTKIIDKPQTEGQFKAAKIK